MIEALITDAAGPPDEQRPFVFGGKVARANIVFGDDTWVRIGAFRDGD